MTRASAYRLFPALAIAALCLFAQSDRDTYTSLYRSWRNGDPNLESDAAAAPADGFAERTQKAAELASAYGAAHATSLKNTAEQQLQNLQWLGANLVQSLPGLAPAPAEIRFVDRESTTVNASVANFANDPDRGIQQLRQAFQREQAALNSLKTSIVDRQEAEDQAIKTVSAAEQERAKAMEEYTLLTTALTQSAAAMNQETAALGTYYASLADAVRAAAAAAPAPAPSVSAVPPAPSITPVPLVRYTGVWSYRPGLPFFGSEPEVVDFVLHEDNGHATGTFYGRFKVPPSGAAGKAPQGNADDPVFRFDFAGDFTPTLKQTFKLTTKDGGKGTVDLNPGVAFNELEVNFSAEAQPGKIRQGDMLLLKQ